MIKTVSSEHKNTSFVGSKWERQTDSFVFKVKLNFSERKRKIGVDPDLKNEDVPYFLPLEMTKRQILSQLSGLWDPQGFAAPIIIKGKIRMRRLWPLKLQWDDPIPADVRKEWEKSFTELCLLERLSFQRCMKPIDVAGYPSLVIFWDVSEEAYGVVAYILLEIVRKRIC